MKKLFNRLVSLLIISVFSLLFVTGCSLASTLTTSYGYDENGNYVKYIYKNGVEQSSVIIVEGVSETNAVVVTEGVTISYKNDESEVEEALTSGASFNNVVEALNSRCEAGTNTKTLQTSFDGASPTLGLPITGNVKLTQNINIGYNGNSTFRFFIVGNVTIDLNGFTITQQCGTDGFSGYALFVVRENATLNVIDSSQEKTGCINGVVSAIQVNSGGVATLYDGTIVCSATMTVTDATETYFCIYTVATYGGTFVQNGGVVKTVNERPILNSTEVCSLTDYNFAFATYDSETATSVTSKIVINKGEVIGEIDPIISSLGILTDNRKN